MTRTYNLLIVLLALTTLNVVALSTSAERVRGGDENWSLWADVLQDHVKPGSRAGIPINVVDYTSLSTDTRFEQVVASLRAKRSFANRSDMLAFYINVYNILAMHTVITNPCMNGQVIESIRDISTNSSSVWDRQAAEVNGVNVSLNDVEDLLRNPLPYPEDSRIHSSIVCASISCPNVHLVPFTASSLEHQLSFQMRDWMNNTQKGVTLFQSNHTISLSPIFKWFGDDFKKENPRHSILDFILPYVPLYIQVYLKDHIDTPPTIIFKGYDWNLNGPLSPSVCE